MSEPGHPLSLFAGIGVELEYMIVEEGSLAVLPIADGLICRTTGACQSDVIRGSLAWSNELALHVVELKMNAPAISLDGLPDLFQSEVRYINQQLRAFGGRLMPTGMHPWMNPQRETRLWPHEYSPVYEAFHRIFDCHRHGWANLQSMHLNFPFADDTEFARLHAAIRLVLPLLPVLAASSPFQDGLGNGCLDRRLLAYRLNSVKIPSIAGQIIPEPVFTRREYEEQILRRMYRDIAPQDPAGILQDEFLNARGAIARFCRNTIEIRLIDMQECPAADLAVAAATLAVIRALVDERWSNLEFQKSLSTDLLENILLATIAQGDRARVDDGRYLRAFGLAQEPFLPAGKLWQLLLAKVPFPESPDADQWRKCINLILDQGCLARRILRATGRAPSRRSLYEVYRRLCDCLETGKTFIP